MSSNVKTFVSQRQLWTHESRGGPSVQLNSLSIVFLRIATGQRSVSAEKGKEGLRKKGFCSSKYGWELSRVVRNGC